MSTRCHIQIKQADGSLYSCMIYKHSDGYPDFEGCGVMSWLPKLVKDFFEDRGDDAEYCVAQILRQEAIKDYCDFEKQIKVNKKKKLKDSWPSKNLALNYLGWGVCLTSERHGDIAYMYTVDLKDGTVTYEKA